MGEREDRFLKDMGLTEYSNEPEMDRTFKQAIEDIVYRLIFEEDMMDNEVRMHIFDLFSKSIEESIAHMRQEFMEEE